MRLTIGEAREFVRARLDELAAQESDMLLGAIDDRNLDNTIDMLLEEAIKYIHLAAPASLMEGPILTESSFGPGDLDVTNRVLDIDTALAQTDDDILRLISFQCGDSDIKLTEAFYEDSPEARMQLNRYIQGQPDSPVLVRLDDSPNFKPRYKYYTTDMCLDGIGQALRFVLRYFALPKLKGGSISFLPSTLTLGAGINTKTMTVSSTSPWRITSQIPDWLLLSETGGNGTSTISVTVQQNRGVQRSVQITAVNEEGSATVEITQRGYSNSEGSDLLKVASTAMVNGVILMSPSQISNIYELRVAAADNLAWTATLSDTENFYMTPTQGVGTGIENYSTVKVMANSENDTGTARTATITFMAAGVNPITITLRQPTILTVLPEGGSNVVGAPAGSLRFIVTTEGEWTAEPTNVPEGFYLSSYSGSGNGSFIAYYPANEDVEGRLMRVTVSGGGATVGVNIAQAAGSSGYSIGVSPAALGPFPASGDLEGVTGTALVTANAAWTLAAVSESWLTVRTSAEDNTLSVVSMQPNESNAQRTATLTVYISDSPSDFATLTITQLGVEGTITLRDSTAPYNSLTVTSDGGSFSATLQASGSWSLVSNKSWLRITSATSGNAGTSTVNFTITGGTSEDQATIVASLTGTDRFDTYYVTRLAEEEGSISVHRRGSADSNDWVLDNEAQGEAFIVQATGPWTATVNESWVTPTGTAWSGGAGTFTRWFNVTANPGSTRTATVTVTLTGENKKDYFYIRQEGNGAANLDARFSQSEKGAAQDTITLSIYSNIAWSITNVSTGLTLPSGTSTSGTGDKKIQGVVISALPQNVDERTLTITVKNATYNITAVASVVQKRSSTGKYLTITPSASQVPASATSVTISVQSNTSWTASTNTAGASVSPSSGENNGSFTLSFNANQGAMRLINVSVSGTGISSPKTLSIQQMAGQSSSLVVDPSTVSLNGAGTAQSVSVWSDTPWSLSKSDSWIITSVSPDTSSTAASFTISAAPNTGAQRSGSVTVRNGDNSLTIAVSQSASDALSLSSDTLNIGGAQGASNTIQVYSSGAWNVDSSTLPAWLSYAANSKSGSMSGQTLEFFAESANTGLVARSATVSIYLVGSSPLVSQSLTVVQANYTILTVSPSTVTAAAGGDEGVIGVNCNTDWTLLSIEPDNTIIVPVEDRSGNGTGQVNWSLPGNTGGQRQFVLNFRTDDGQQRASVTITQPAGVLIVSPASLPFAGSGEEKLATLTSSSAWRVLSKPEWITVEPMEGIANTPNGTPLTIEADRNPNTQYPRTGQITFYQYLDPNASPYTMNVTQTAGDEKSLTINPTTLTLPDNTEYEGTLEIGTTDHWTIITNHRPNGYFPSDEPSEEGIEFEEWQGDGNAEVDFTVPANGSAESRTLWAKVLINGGTTVKTLTVWQPGAYSGLAVYPDVNSIVFSQSQPTATIYIESADGWSAVSNEPWLTFSPSYGLARTSVAVTFNPTISRTYIQRATFTITTTGGQTRTITCSSLPTFVPIDD